MRTPRPASILLWAWLAGLAGAGSSDTALLAPRLSRRLAIEDEPLVLEVTLPEGMPLTGRPAGPRVGDAGLRYAYTWRLLEGSGSEPLRTHTSEHGRTSDRWLGPTFVEPYQARFEGRLEVEVEVAYRDPGGGLLQQARARFPVPRIQDATPPLTPSHGDEEEYEPFRCESLTVPDGGVATTTDGVLGEDGTRVPRSPFEAILDDGRTLEGDPEDPASLGALEFEWANVFDNLAPPFTGEPGAPLGRFGLYMIPRWDLAGSHHLVSGASSPHMAATREMVREEGEAIELYLVDLAAELGDPPPEGGSYGEGRVRIPLPYDRVGDLEVGFFAEDRAWPSPNHTRVGHFRFRVEDDIAPGLLFSLRKIRRHETSWLTADSVNRRWHSGARVFELPRAFGGPAMQELPALAVRVQTAYAFQAMAFDNTRLARGGLRIELEGPGGAGYGMRLPGRPGRRTSWDLPADGFDPSLARTPRGEPAQLFFGSPGRYRLRLEALDVHGNRRELVVELEAEERDADWIRISEDRVRIHGGSR